MLPFLPLTREVARAQRVTEGETNQMPTCVVAGFPSQNSEFRNQMSERVVAGFPVRIQRPEVRGQKSERVGRGLAPAANPVRHGHTFRL